MTSVSGHLASSLEKNLPGDLGLALHVSIFWIIFWAILFEIAFCWKLQIGWTHPQKNQGNAKHIFLLSNPNIIFPISKHIAIQYPVANANSGWIGMSLNMFPKTYAYLPRQPTKTTEGKKMVSCHGMTLLHDPIVMPIVVSYDHRWSPNISKNNHGTSSKLMHWYFATSQRNPSPQILKIHWIPCGFQWIPGTLWGIPSRLSLGRRPLRRRRARAAEPGRRPEAAERRRCHGGDVGISAEARLPGPVTSKSSKDVDGDMIVTDSEFSRNLNSLYMFVCKCYNMLYSYYYYILLYYLCMLYVLSIKQMVSSCSWSGKRTKLWQGSSMRTCNQDLRGAKSSGWVLNTCDWNPQMDAPWIYISDLLW